MLSSRLVSGPWGRPAGRAGHHWEPCVLLRAFRRSRGDRVPRSCPDAGVRWAPPPSLCSRASPRNVRHSGRRATGDGGSLLGRPLRRSPFRSREQLPGHEGSGALQLAAACFLGEDKTESVCSGEGEPAPRSLAPRSHLIAVHVSSVSPKINGANVACVSVTSDTRWVCSQNEVPTNKRHLWPRFWGGTGRGLSLSGAFTTPTRDRQQSKAERKLQRGLPSGMLSRS